MSIDVIDMKQEIIRRNLKGEVVQACYYALADISQEINAVVQTLARVNNGSVQDTKKYVRKMSPEDLKIIRKLLDTHSKNLAALAQILPDSGFPTEWTVDDLDTFNQSSKTYQASHRTIIHGYMDEIINNHPEFFSDD